MGLTMKEKKAVSKEVAERYQKSTKKEKGKILDEFVSLTGYHRIYASYTLKNWTRKAVIKKTKRNKEKIYDQEVGNVIKKIWYICDCICSKRLAPYLQEIVSVLENKGEIYLDEKIKRKVLNISAASIDRLLKKEKQKMILKGKSRTKPGTLLKNQILIKTFSEWNNKEPGFVEVDLVAHDGGYAKGDYAQTLDLTDVATGWTETQAIKNKAQIWTFEAIKDIRKHLPFNLLGLDSDNGGEFINDQLLRYCEQEGITFTRSRPYRKNDNCYVEQKNYSIVRRAVGYSRYEGDEEVRLLNQLYQKLRLYTNFFQPVMKLIGKERIGSKSKKKYDQAKTPYQRVRESLYVSKENKKKLQDEYIKLNPAQLKRDILQLQDKLAKRVRQRQRNKEEFPTEECPNIISLTEIKSF